MIAVMNGVTPPNSAINKEQPMKYHADTVSMDATTIATIPPKQKPAGANEN